MRAELTVRPQKRLSQYHLHGQWHMDVIKGTDCRLSSSPCRPRIADCTQLKAVGFADNDWRARLTPEHAWHAFSTKDVVHHCGANVVRALRWLFDVVDLAPATNHIGHEESKILFEKMEAAKRERRAFVRACCRLSFAECPGDTPWLMRVGDAHEWCAVHMDEVVERCSDLDAPFKALMHGDTAMLAPPARPADECAKALKDELNARVAEAPRAGQRPSIVDCAQIKCGPSGWQARWGPGHDWHVFDIKQVAGRCVGTHAAADASRNMLTHHAVIDVGPPVREYDERAHKDAVAELVLVVQEFDDHCNAASQLRFITPLHDDDPGWRMGGRDGWRAVRTIDVVERCGANLVAPREALSHGIAALPAAHETDALPDEQLDALAAELEAERLATMLHSPALQPACSSWIRVGDRVEVAQTAEGFEGARYVARVMAAPHGGCMDVEYEAFQEDASERRLREQVLTLRVRPLPPRAPDEWLVNASAGFQVDVDFEEGWWPASVQQLPGPCDVEPHAEAYCHNFGLSRRFTLSSLRPRWYFDSCAFRWEMHTGGGTHFRVAAVSALSSTSANGEHMSVLLRPLCEDDVYSRALRAGEMNPKLRIENVRPWDTLQRVMRHCQRRWKRVGPSTITFFMDPSRKPIESLDVTIERLCAMESMKAFAVELFYSADGIAVDANTGEAPLMQAAEAEMSAVERAREAEEKTADVEEAVPLLGERLLTATAPVLATPPPVANEEVDASAVALAPLSLEQAERAQSAKTRAGPPPSPLDQLPRAPEAAVVAAGEGETVDAEGAAAAAGVDEGEADAGEKEVATEVEATPAEEGARAEGSGAAAEAVVDEVRDLQPPSPPHAPPNTTLLPWDPHDERMCCVWCRLRRRRRWGRSAAPGTNAPSTRPTSGRRRPSGAAAGGSVGRARTARQTPRTARPKSPRSSATRRASAFGSSSRSGWRLCRAPATTARRAGRRRRSARCS